MAKKQTAPPPGAPDADDILDLYRMRLGETDEGKLRKRTQFHRQLCEMEHAVNIPSEYKAIAKEIRTPFVRDTWLRVAAALVRDTPVAHVEPRDETIAARQAANIAERFHMASVEAMTRERGEDLMFENAKAIVRDQEAVIKCVHKPDAWANFPKREGDETPDAYVARTTAYKKSSPMPFAARVVDRLSMLFGDGEFGDTWALEYGEYPRPWLKSQYGMVVEEGDGTGYYLETDSNGTTFSRSRKRLVSPEMLLGGKPFPQGELATGGAGMCTKVEYWDDKWWCVVIDGTMAPDFPKANPYAPRIPYFRGKSDPVLFALSFLVPGFDSLLTMWLNWAYIGAYPTPQLVAPANAVPSLGDVGVELEPTGGESQKVTWKPGQMQEPPPGYSYTFIQPPPIGQDVQQMAQIYRQLIEQAGVASVMRGSAGSDFSGYLANQLAAMAQLTYRNLGTAIQRQLADMGEFMWHVINTRIKQEVYVLATEGKPASETRTWLGLKPTGKTTGECAPIDMLAQMSITLRPVLPTDEQAAAMVAVQLTNAPKPLLSRRRAIEKHLQEEDPEGMLDEIAVEDALDNDPTLKTLQVHEALRVAGYLPQAQSGLLGPDGQPLPSSGAPGTGGPGGPPTPFFPGQVSGQPGVPGMTQPLQPGPPPPPGVLMGQGGRPAGAYPGQPGG